MVSKSQRQIHAVEHRVNDFLSRGFVDTQDLKEYVSISLYQFVWLALNEAKNAIINPPNLLPFISISKLTLHELDILVFGKNIVSIL